MSFIHLKSFSNYLEANIAASMLQENGINCHLEHENSITIVHMSSGIRLFVYATQAERALEILVGAEQEYIKAFACTGCGKHDLVLRYVKREVDDPLRKSLPYMPGLGLLNQLSNFLSGDDGALNSKVYVCTSCGKPHDELPDLPEPDDDTSEE